VLIKKTEEMDLYEILNVKKSASQQEIESTYNFEKLSYHRDSLAHYTLLSEEERQLHLRRIEEAFNILGNPKKRKIYDSKMLNYSKTHQETAYFRRSIQKLLIEDAEKPSFLLKIFRNLFSFSKKH